MLLSVLLLLLFLFCSLTVASSAPESGGSEMVEQSGSFRPWDEVTADVLGLIFAKLSLPEILNVVPIVCRGWRQVVAGSYCWKEIDIMVQYLNWCWPEQVDRMVRMLVSRSSNFFTRLSVNGIKDEDTLEFIAQHAGSLETLVLLRCNISNSIVENVAEKLSNLTFLDVSGCQKISALALEAIGKNCNSLTGLRRAMNPLEIVDRVSQDDEASAIATTMPRLKHLKMPFALLTTEGVLQILSGCRDLELLDIRGCWYVQLQQNFLEEEHAGLTVLGPEIDDYYERKYWDDLIDDSDVSVCSWELLTTPN